MAEERGDSSIFSKVASSAGFAKGAIKTGKALAGVTKGAAAGPYGLMASVLWEGRHIVGKALAAFALLLFLPIIYVMMLPSLIFGPDGLDNASKNIWTDSGQILENMAEVESGIEEILSEKHADVLKAIEKKVNKLDSDCTYSITDNFSDNIVYESALVISQYCASKNDYEDISLWNLKWLLRRNLKNIFSYDEEITTIEQQVETTDEVVQITHHNFVVRYTGDVYFAGEIFELTETQKATAKTYARNLERFLSDIEQNME